VITDTLLYGPSSDSFLYNILYSGHVSNLSHSLDVSLVWNISDDVIIQFFSVQGACVK
jgi:hypothetical protein